MRTVARRAAWSLAIGLALLASTLPATAIVPATMNFQGRLTDNTPGQTPVDQVLPMIFRIYDAASGGTLLWTEIWPAVNVSGGLFSVQLGSSGSPLNETVFADPDRFIEIEVDTEVLSPRQQLSAVAFAQQAENSESLGGSPAASWQKRVATSCGPGIHMRGVDVNGAPICEAAPPGDITDVFGGIGLSGGASTGSATLDVDFDGTGYSDKVARADHTHSGADLPFASAQRVRVSNVPISGGNLFAWLPGEQTLSGQDAFSNSVPLSGAVTVFFEGPLSTVRPQDYPGDGVITVTTLLTASAEFFTWQEYIIANGNPGGIVVVSLLDESNFLVRELELDNAWPLEWSLGYLPTGEPIVTITLAASAMAIVE